MEADVCDEETEAYVTNLSYYHLVPFETDILEWGIYTTDDCKWTADVMIEEYVLLSGSKLCNAARSRSKLMLLLSVAS